MPELTNKERYSYDLLAGWLAEKYNFKQSLLRNLYEIINDVFFPQNMTIFLFYILGPSRFGMETLCEDLATETSPGNA